MIFRGEQRLARACLISALAMAGVLGATIVRADDFQLEDVAIAASLGSYKAKRIDVTGSPLTKDAAQKLLSSSAAGTGEEKFAQLDAARIAIPELIAESAAGDLTQTVIYRDVVIAKAAKGVAETVDVASAELSAKRGEIVNRGRIGAIHAEGVDFPALLRVAAGARKSPDEAKKITTRKLSVAGVDIEADGGGKVAIGAIEGSDFGGRALSAPLAGLAEAAPRPGGPEPSPDAKRAMAAMAGDILTSLDVGVLEMRDIVSTMPGPNKDAPESVRFKRIGVSKLADGRIGGFTLEGIAAGKDDAKLEIERIDLTGLEIGRSLAAAAAVDPKPVTPHFDRLEVAGLAMNLPDGPISFGRAVIDARDWLDVAPTKLTLRLERALVSLAGPGAARSAPVAALGYDKIDLSAAFEAQYDPPKGELSVDRLETDAAGMGAARLSLFLSRVPASLFAGDVQAAQLALPSVSVWRADIGLSDRGLLQRYVAVRAKDERKTEAQIRAELATLGTGMARALFAAQPNSNPQVESLAGAVSAFAKGAPNLDIRVSAPDGMSVLDLSMAAQMGSLAERLKIEARAR